MLEGLLYYIYMDVHINICNYTFLWKLSISPLASPPFLSVQCSCYTHLPLGSSSWSSLCHVSPFPHLHLWPVHASASPWNDNSSAWCGVAFPCSVWSEHWQVLLDRCFGSRSLETMSEKFSWRQLIEGLLKSACVLSCSAVSNSL